MEKKKKKKKKIFSQFSHVCFIIFCQVFLLLVKRLASLHYNTHQDNPKSFRLPSTPSSPLPPPQSKTIQENNTTKNSCSYQPIKDSDDIERDNNLNQTTNYDEVDFKSTSDSNYKERINETINNSLRSEENMGSNVSTSGGKGLSGRRTQSSSELKISFDHFYNVEYH
jgi:hypothetical protein